MPNETQDKAESSNDVKGEGNPDADRRYRKSAREFVKDGNVEKAAEAAKNMTDEEKAESKKAEREALARKKS